MTFLKAGCVRTFGDCTKAQSECRSVSSHSGERNGQYKIYQAELLIHYSMALFSGENKEEDTRNPLGFLVIASPKTHFADHQQ